jgi:hypothetical protein
VKVTGGIKTLYGPVYFPNPGGGNRYSVRGQGRAITRLQVASNFPLSVNGVFIADAEIGPNLADFSMEFIQPDTTTIGSYTHWPAALYMNAAGRFEAHRLLIIGAWDGINMAGNAGGAVIENVWMSAYNRGIVIQNALDSVRINDFHFWVFGCTNNQITAMTANATGIEATRADDLAINSMLGFGKWGIRFLTGGSGVSFGTVVNSGFDTFSGIYMEAGIMTFSGCYFSPGLNNRAVHMTGGALRMTGCNVITGVGNTASLCYVNFNNAADSNSFSFTNSNVLGVGNDVSFVEAVSAAGSLGHILISHNTLYWVANATYARPLIDISGIANYVTVTENYVNAKGSGTGKFLNIAYDGFHRVANNTLNGWAVTYPTGPLGRYDDSAWADLTLQNSWVADNAGANPSFVRDGHWVTIHGLMKLGTTTNATLIAQLPVGYRPLSVELFPIVFDNSGSPAVGKLLVAVGGGMTIYGVTSNVQVSLSGVRFRVQ